MHTNMDNKYLSPDSLTPVILLQATNRAHSHLPHFWHNICLYQPLRTYQHHSTLYLSCPLPPQHTSFVCLPVARHPIPPVPHCSNNLLSTFQHHHLFFKSSCCSYPITLSQPPTSISLSLPETLSSLSLTHSSTLLFCCLFRQRGIGSIICQFGFIQTNLYLYVFPFSNSLSKKVLVLPNTLSGQKSHLSLSK